MIGGFIVEGQTSKRVMIRAIGPSLTNQGAPLAGRLQDPALALHAAGGEAPFASNDNWRQSPQQSEIAGSGLAPTHDSEAAVIATLAPGQYTAVVTGAGGQTGTGLVEIYALTADEQNPKLANLSTRGAVDSGEDVLIAGVIVGGGGTGSTSRITLRAIGPSLAERGVLNPLSDPTLELVDQQGSRIAFNDNWQDGDNVELQFTGLTPTHPAEAALLRTLAAGNYTAVVRGTGGTKGTALVEVYDTPASDPPPPQ